MFRFALLNGRNDIIDQFVDHAILAGSNVFEFFIRVVLSIVAKRLLKFPVISKIFKGASNTVDGFIESAVVLVAIFEGSPESS